MVDSAESQKNLKALMDKLRTKEIGPLEFLRKVSDVIVDMDLTDEDMASITPLILNLAQRLIRAMEKRGG